MDFDLKTAQLMCSRLCHDLVGAAGAVNAGLELVEETKDINGEAFTMTKKSAQEVTRRLMFFRAAFGLGGTEGFDVPSLGRIVKSFMDDTNINLYWPDSAPGTAKAPPEAAKLLLNLCLLGAECLPRGGDLHTDIAILDDGVGIAISADGTGAILRDDLRDALCGKANPNDLTARTVHAYLASLLALSFDQQVECQQFENSVTFATLIPVQ